MKYVSPTNAVIRYPAYPIMVVEKILNDSNEFRNLIVSDRFKEAIYFASPSLYDELLKFIDGQLSDKDSKRLQTTLVKYICRMSTRCTPFALFAACTVARITDTANLVIPSSVDRVIRCDMLALCMLSQILQADPEQMRNSRYKANNTIYHIGHRIRYITYRYTTAGRTYRLSELPHTVILSEVIRYASDFVDYKEIITHLTDKFDISEKEALLYVHSLIKNQILISELAPTITGEDYLDRLACISVIHKDHSNPAVELQKLIYDINNADTTEKRLAMAAEIDHHLLKHGIKCSRKYELQVDMCADTVTMNLPDSIVQQITTCMKFMAKILPKHICSPALQDFKHRMEQRYEGEEIPLLEALDPEAGIGYAPVKVPVRLPLVGALKFPASKKQTESYYYTRLNQVLITKIQQNGNDSCRCVHLTDDDFTDQPEDTLSSLPVTMVAMFKLLDRNSNNDYLIDSLFFSGSSAVNLLGRFAYCSQAINEIVQTVTAHEQSAYQGYAVAEIAHITEARTGNVLARPSIREYEIEYLTNSTMPHNKAIPASDIMVSVRNDRIMLRSRKLGKYIIPRLTTAHNYSNNTTPVYRFLCDMQTYNLRPSLKFSWDSTGIVRQHYPRVMYRNVIMAREMWRCRKSDLTTNNGRLDPSLIEQWRKASGIPRHVQLIAGDNVMPIDFENTISQNVFLAELAHCEAFVIEEFLFPHNVTTDAMGRDYMNECIIPLIRVK